MTALAGSRVIDASRQFLAFLRAAFTALERRDLRSIVAYVVVIAAVSNTVAVLRSDGFLDYDSASYITPGKNFWSGRGYSSPNFLSYMVQERLEGGRLRPDTMRPPMYPLLVGWFAARSQLRGAVAVNALLNVVVAGFATLIGSRMSGSKAVAFASGVLYAVFPPALQTGSHLMSEPLFCVVFFSALMLFERSLDGSTARAATAGGLIGLAIVTRPVAEFVIVPLVIIALLLGRRHRAMLALIFVIFAALPPVAWSLRNQRVAGVFTLSSLYPESILFWRAGGTLAVEGKGMLYAATALQADNTFRRDLRRLHVTLQREATPRIATLSRRNPYAMTHAQRAWWYERLGVAVIREHKTEALLVSLSGFTQLVFCGPAEFLMSHDSRLGTAYLIGLPMALALIALAGRGFVILWHANRRRAILGGAMILYFLAVSSGPESVYRLLVPIAPYLAACLSAGALSNLLRTSPNPWQKEEATA